MQLTGVSTVTTAMMASTDLYTMSNKEGLQYCYFIGTFNYFIKLLSNIKRLENIQNRSIKKGESINSRTLRDLSDVT